MKLRDLIEMEPQHCSDPNCDGEITYDETNRRYECMKCGNPAQSRKSRARSVERQHAYDTGADIDDGLTDDEK